MTESLPRAVAPRVTLEEINANMKQIEYVKHVSPTGQILRWAVVTMANGFAAVGKPSAAVSPANDNEQYGQKAALDNTIESMWQLMGYDLRSRLARIEAAPAMQEKMALLFPEAKTYVGTKVVHGTPMTLGKYNDFRGWTMPNGEDPEAEGYLVEYTDGGKPNIQGFFGYVSWSPKDVFEGAYQIGFEPRKETYVDRMKQEYTRLVTDIAKLRTFIASSTYAELPREERDDQLEQVAAMVNHSWYLGRRLRRLGITITSE